MLQGQVTPCVGVWIEMDENGNIASSSVSLPVWECGLKSGEWAVTTDPGTSLPVWECGLKFYHLWYHIQNLCHSLCGSVD